MMPKMLKKKAVQESVWDLALSRMRRAYDLFDSIGVSFSGGKDSTVCLNLARVVAKERGRLPLRVFFFDEEAIPYQTEEYVRRVAAMPDIALEWYCLPVRHRNACSRTSPWWSPWDPACPDLWVRPHPPEGIVSIPGFSSTGEPRDRLSMPESVGLLHDPAKYGNAGMVMGIRGQESLLRQRAVITRTADRDNFIIHWTGGTSRGNTWKIYPIYDWQTEDVWTAPNLYGWDYNRAYDVMEQAGITHLAQRVSPAYGEEPMRGFHIYKQCFPEIWDQMSRRVPGANAALLYGRTELYSFGKNPEKPDDMSWEEYISHFVAKYPPIERRAVASTIARMIREHYNKTDDPILEEVDHPLSGLSYKRLLNLAVRGDLKERRMRTMTAHSASSNPNPDLVWAKYRQAREVAGL